MLRNSKYFYILLWIISLFLAYRIGILSRSVHIKDIPKYFQHLSEYVDFKKITKLSPQSKTLDDIPKYIHDYRLFEKLGGKITGTFPILDEYKAQAGTIGGQYFHQDLLVASFIYQASPVRHIDVGSRLDGFVAHVASFRKIEVLDIRDLQQSEHKNILFTKLDLMSSDNIPSNITDSISSLHAIEHFGLGRYGDTVDPNGHIKGFNNILKMLKPNGILYISFPIGTPAQVLFNAHRIFNPLDVLNWAYDKNSLELLRFDYVDDNGELHQNADLYTQTNNLNDGCGIYTFRKIR